MMTAARRMVRILTCAAIQPTKKAWAFARNDMVVAWRTTRIRILFEMAILAAALMFGIRINMPPFYVEQAERAGKYAVLAAALSDEAESEADRVFFGREADWYSRQRTSLLREAAWYALRGVPTLADPADYNRATIHEFAILERLELHGGGWTSPHRLADRRRRAADESARHPRRVESGSSVEMESDLSSMKPLISNDLLHEN